MNLKRMQEIINELVSEIEKKEGTPTAGTENGPEVIPVVVVLSEPSVGKSSTAEVVCAGLGFDWDAGSFILRTKEDLVRENYGRGYAKIQKTVYDEKPCYSCSNCCTIVSESDKFCKHCGKEFRIGREFRKAHERDGS